MTTRAAFLQCTLPLLVFGKKLPFRDVRDPVATGGKPDMALIAQFGRD